MEYNKKSKFCMLPFMTLNTRPNGQVKPCSQVMGMTGIKKHTTVETLLESDNAFCNLTSDKIEDIWNSEFLKDFRMKKINNEYIEFCETCYQEDAIGVDSKRKSVIDKYYDTNKHLVEEAASNNGEMSTMPVWWEMRLSSKCNQACRMCIPQTSSMMRKEFIKFADELPTSIKNNTYSAMSQYNKNGYLGDSEFFIDQFWENVSDIKYLELHGGEPTVDNTLWDLVEQIVDAGHSDHMHIHVHTNIHSLTERHIELWDKFKSGWLGVSIDAYKEENEYIRHGSKWDNIERNLKLVKGLGKQWSIWVTSSVMVYNCLTMHRLIYWFIDYKQCHGLDNVQWRMDPVTNPNIMRLEHVPLELRLTAIEKLNTIIDDSTVTSIEQLRGALKSELVPPKDSLTELAEYTKILDKKRNQDVYKIFPKLTGIL